MYETISVPAKRLVPGMLLSDHNSVVETVSNDGSVIIVWHYSPMFNRFQSQIIQQDPNYLYAVAVTISEGE